MSTEPQNTASSRFKQSGTRFVTLDLNETGFLCNMMMKAFEMSDLPRSPEGLPIIPEALGRLFKKLATINDELMKEAGHAPLQ